MKKISKSKYTGFTLIEMMVTIAIVGIFASIAVPSFSQLMERNRISTATNEIISNLVLARSEALKRSNNVTICTSTNQSTCSGGTDYSDGWIVFLDCNADGARATGATVDCGSGSPTESEVLIKVNDGFQSIFATDTSDNIGNVTFGFSGRIARSRAYRFEIGKDSGDIRKNIFLNRVGRIRTVDL